MAATEETQRLTADEIYDAAAAGGRDELSRSTRALAFSGLAGGFTMGLTGISVAAVRALLGEGSVANLVAMAFYPTGFIAVILGRAQLFTENTLYPVVLVLRDGRYIDDTLRLWATVFAANVLGAFCFALLAANTSALRSDVGSQLVRLGVESIGSSASALFWSGVIGGWLIALVAWLVTASQWTIGQIAVIWLLAFVVGVGRFAHCIAGSGEILTAVLAGRVTAGAYFYWLLFGTLGNIVGGTVIVSVLNWGQVHNARPARAFEPKQEEPERKAA